MDVGIRELRDGLSRHLDRVRKGGTITITDHGQADRADRSGGAADEDTSR